MGVVRAGLLPPALVTLASAASSPAPCRACLVLPHSPFPTGSRGQSSDLLTSPPVA